MRERLLWVACIVAVLIASFAIGQCASKNDYKEKVATFEAERRNWLAERQALKSQRDSVIRAASQNARQDSLLVRELAEVIDRSIVEQKQTKATIAGLRRKVASPSDTAELRQTASAAIDLAERTQAANDTLTGHLTSTRDALVRANADKAELIGVIRRLEMSEDSAAVLLNRVPIHKGDRLLGFIPLPSRSASFAIGAVAATVLTIWVTK